MTRKDAMLNAYMGARRALFNERAPLVDWEVYVSPEDAMNWEMEVISGAPIGQYVMGATWRQDATVPVGEIWLKLPRRNKLIIKF